MKLTDCEGLFGWMRVVRGAVLPLLAVPPLLLVLPLLLVAMLAGMGGRASAQGVSTTTVQGTVYLANGQPGGGTLTISWPAFTTAAGQAIAADRLTVAIGADGFVSVNLAPNQGATPAGEYYTAVFYMSDGSTSTEYWVVPTGAQATIAQVRAQVMPAAQAVQAVTKTYVDQSMTQLQESLLTASGGNLSGPLYLNGDPSQNLQAADKHYVDAQVATAVPVAGGTMTGGLMLNGDPTQDLQAADKHYVDAAAANAWPSLVLRTDQFAGADFGAQLQACVNAVSASTGGTCDARNFSGSQTMGANVTISTANTTVLLPCASIATANQIVITGGTRNVALRGCALRGGSAASGSQGGSALAYTGAGALIQVGDPAYLADTPGFHLDNVVINTTGSSSPSAQGLVAYRTQEMDVESVYFLGNGNQTGMTLDGTGNYTGGTFLDVEFGGFQTAVNAIGHQIANPATTDWMNASAFVRLHIDCPTSGGNPVAGTTGINLVQGDGNTFTGGDVEGCATALHLGPNAQNNTVVGLRNENSTNQVVADAGSSYNNWMTGGTMFTGKLTDNGTRNSFWDTFHRNFNGMTGDQYRSQIDSTITNRIYTGIGVGHVRGLTEEYTTDVPGVPGNYQNVWQWGPTDGTSGEQDWLLTDMLNNVPRFGVQQMTSGGGNPQTYLNAAGGGNVCFNCSTNSGTGGVAFSSGGSAPATVASVDHAGDAQFNGTLQVNGTSQSNGTLTVRNSADAEVDYYLWPGKTASQKGSFTYKDWNGNSQWYMVKDQSNNWALNSAVGGLDSFKAYQSTNSGDTYVNASNTTGVVRVNYESGSGSAFKVYGGNSGTVYASFTGANSIAFPGLAAGTGHNCLQVDTSGYVTNTGAECGSGSGGSGTVNSSSSGYIAYYTGNGSAIGGMSSVPVTAGGTGAATPAAALANLGALAISGGTLTGALNGTSANFSGAMSATTTSTAKTPEVNAAAYGAVGDCSASGATTGCTDNFTALTNACNAAKTMGGSVLLAPNPASVGGIAVYYTGSTIRACVGVSMHAPIGLGLNNTFRSRVEVRGAPGLDVFAPGDPTSTGYSAPSPGFVWSHFGIIVDDSTDVSATINGGHRKPGFTCNDVTVTNGSPTITSTSQCEFTQGDVGQNISVTAGSNTLTTTIAAVGASAGFGSNTATLAANWTYSGSSAATAYVAIMGLPLTARVGNCALAYDDSTSIGSNGPNQARFEDMSITTTSGNYQNDSCAFFFQGNSGYPYATVWNHLFSRTQWGLLAVPADAATSTNAAFGDINRIQDWFIEATYPWVSYDGEQNTWSGGQIASALDGPQLLIYGGAGSESGTEAWTINNGEFETQGTSGGMGWRIEGTNHALRSVQLIDSSETTPAQWDAWASKCEECQAYGTLNVTGGLNMLRFSDGADHLAVNDSNGSNDCRAGRWLGPLDGKEPGTWQSCSPSSRSWTAFEHTGDFVSSGNLLTPYNNKNDLWVWPQDLEVSGSTHPAMIADSSSESGFALVVPSSMGFPTINGQPITIAPSAAVGPNLPATKIQACAKVKAPSGTPYFYLELFVNGSNIGQAGGNLSASYQTLCFNADLSSYAGSTNVQWVLNPTSGTAYVAWIGVKPWADSYNAKGAITGGSLVDTGVVSATTLGTDSNGNVIAGPGAGTVVYTSSQTASAADAGKMVVMNCSAYCTYTLPTTHPTSTWQIWLESTGSTTATVGTGSGVTVNGNSGLPVLLSYRPMVIAANAASVHDYVSDAPLVAGTGITLTPGQLGLTVSATGPQISGSPATGKATCWKSATQIGYCSTQPDSTGACTCN